MRNLLQLPRRISGSLSRGRRSRLAAPLVLLFALLTVGGVFTVLQPASAEQKTASADEVAQGKALFLVGCASCHGKNGEGIVTKRGNQYGPPLAGVGAAAVDFQVSTGRMPMAQPGTQAKRKPRVYDEAETELLEAYVASLGPGPDVPTQSEYDPSDVDNEGIVAGGELFRKNCTACHNFGGAGGALRKGRYAPKLTGVSPKHIFEALETGPQQMPVFSNDVMTPEDKKNIIAYLKKNEETPAYGGFSLGSLGPVAEGFMAWGVGIGGLVGAAIWIASHTARSKRKGNPA